MAAVGERYGMEAHWDKFQLLAVQTEPTLHTPAGDSIPCRPRMLYLGTTLSNDVHDQHELVKRIAMAKQDFLALDCVWKRSSLTWRRKLRIFNSLIESKLLYSLSTICLTVSQERQLNGFQNRCLRVIIGIKPSYLSRVSNAAVLAKAGHTRPQTCSGIDSAGSCIKYSSQLRATHYALQHSFLEQTIH